MDMIINYSMSFQALDRYVLRFNNDQLTIGTKIRQSMMATAKELIKIYGVSLVKSNKVNPVDPHHLPSLRTNNVQLATITQASGRTIQRHMARLLECGIVTEKIWHGSHSSYELFINPKILWIKGIGSAHKTKDIVFERNKITTNNQEVKKTNPTKCPHSYTNKIAYKRNNRVIAVEKLQNSWVVNFDKDSRSAEKNTNKSAQKTEERCSLSLTTFNDAEKKAKKETEKTRRKDLSEKDARRKDVWREHPELDKKTVDGKQNSTENIENRQHNATRHTFLSQYVNELWELARDKLYKGIWLNTRQCNIALTLLYQWYEPVSDEKLEYVHKVYKTRVFLVEKYIKKAPLTRFVTLPYLYFDPTNPNGFTGTKPWYEAEKKHKATLTLQRILSAQIRKFKQNESKDTATARPRLTVFRECEQRLGKLELPELLQQFYEAVLTPQNHTS